MPKPSTERVRAVLQELYALDPTLRAHGRAVEQAVTTLLAARPDVRVNPQFAAKLRTQLAASPPISPKSQSPSFMKTSSSFGVWLPTAALATAAVIVAVVVTQPHLFGLSRTPQEQIHTNGIIPSSDVSISRIDGRGFGELFASVPAGLGGSPETISARPQSGGGGSMPPYGVTEDAVAQGDTTKLIAPAPDNYVYERPRYNYEGELPELATTGDVYRRVKTPITGLGASLTSANLGFLDLGRFGNTQLTQFSLTQPGQYGYQLYVDLNEGVVNINQDWTTWPQPTEMIYEPFAASNVPNDAALIAIANTFLSERGIVTDAYTTPVVDRRWNVVQPYMRGTEALTEDLKIRWAPETITVMYPLELNGLIAYDQSGFPYGLSVSINIREGRVSNVWNLTTLNYEASSYDLVIDTNQIRDIASRGDQYAGPFGQDPNETIRDFSLGEPMLVLMQTWHATSDGRGEDLLIPALRFPVIPDAEGNTGYREAVMVPLVKDMVEPIYRIMESGVGGGSAGTPANTDPATRP